MSSEVQQKHVPRNFYTTLLALFFTKLGDALVDPKTVLPWMIGHMGAPGVLLGFLVPVRESGSLLPQMFIAGLIRRLAVRKWVWVAGSLVQGLAILLLALVVVNLEGVRGGVTLLCLLVLFSLARGFCSIASKDVLGKTIPRQRRGRVSGLSASLAGVVTLAVALLLISLAGKPAEKPLMWLLLAGCCMWFLAAGVYASIREQRGATEVGSGLIKDGFAKFRLLKTDRDFRNLCITRSLLLSSALSAPYYVAIAREHNSDLSLLGHLVLANGAAALVSGYFWGRFADRSSRRVLQITALSTAVLGFAVFLAARFRVDAPAWSYVGAFFLLAVVHNGVRVGRSTYVVDMAEGNRRTDYVAISNTLIGGVLLLAGLSGLLYQFVGAASMVLLLALCALAAVFVATRLPDVTNTRSTDNDVNQ